MNRNTLLSFLAAALIVAAAGGGAGPGPWKARAPMPRAHPVPGQQPVVVNGRIYVILDVGAMHEFDPAGNVWTRQPAPMPTRRHHYATVALDGKIYVIGGCIGEEGTRHERIATVEEYDPVRRVWRNRRPMLTPRMALAAVAYGGRIYTFGGVNDPADVNAVETYDPSTDTWKALPPQKRLNVAWAGALAGNLIYLVGSARGTPVLDVFDPATGTFTERTPRQGLGGFALVSDGKRIFTFGGGDRDLRSAAVDAYDPPTDRWTRVAELPRGKWLPGAAAVDGRIYVMGGVLGKWAEQDDSVLEFFPAAARKAARPPQWRARAVMPTPRLGSVAVALNRKIYVLGGFKHGDIDRATPVSVLEVFDPVANTWTVRGPVPAGLEIALTRGRAVAHAGRIYAFSGSLGSVYSPEKDRWKPIAGLGIPRIDFALVAFDGKLYAIAGIHKGADTAAVEEYDFAKDAWRVRASLPMPGRGLAVLARKGRIYVAGIPERGRGERGLAIYDPAEDRWTVAASMPARAHYSSFFRAGARLLAFPGGFTKPWAIQEFSPADGAWRISDSSGLSPRRLYASAALDGKIYTFGGIEGSEWSDSWNRNAIGTTEEFVLPGRSIM